jgi:hypothetical protein
MTRITFGKQFYFQYFYSKTCSNACKVQLLPVEVNRLVADEVQSPTAGKTFTATEALTRWGKLF